MANERLFRRMRINSIGLATAIMFLFCLHLFVGDVRGQQSCDDISGMDNLYSRFVETHRKTSDQAAMRAAKDAARQFVSRFGGCEEVKEQLQFVRAWLGKHSAQENYDRLSDEVFSCLRRSNCNVNWSAVVQNLTRIIEADPTFVPAYGWRAGIYKDDLNRNDLSLKDFTKAIELTNRGWPNRWAYFRGRSEVYRSLGQISNEIDDITSAISHLPAKATTDDPNGHTYRASLYSQRGFAYFSQKEFAAAAADFSKVIELEPNMSYGYRNRARALNQLGGHKEQVKADLKRCKQLGSSSCSAK